MFAVSGNSTDRHVGFFRLRSLRHLLLACGLGMCLFMLGCGSSGPPMGRVSGRVTYKDQPVANAMVTFVPDQSGAQAATGMTDADGYYKLGTFEKADGALVGKHRVTVVARAPYDGKPIPGVGEAFKEELEQRGKPLIPERYFTANTSPLKAEVTSGSNTHDLSLTD